MSHNPLAFPVLLKMKPPSPSDKTADTDRVVAALGDEGCEVTEVPLNVSKRIPAALRKKDFELDAVIGLKPGTRIRHGERNELKLLDISQGSAYGVALDIGSSNIECALFDLRTGVKLETRGAGNPQISFGSDVLSRVQFAMMGKFEALTETLLAGINSLIGELCRKNRIQQQNVYAVTVAGNTIMSHFFLGLDVTNIPVSPYIPALSSALVVSASEIGLAVNENAVVYVFPNAGSYVGGDIISGMIFAGIHREEEPVLFIDVGTNVEITLGCRDWIMVGAGAAGPALEEGIASIGKKAESGTISKVKIHHKSKEIELDVISGVEPQGICGSGMIDLIAELYAAGIIDQKGRFAGSWPGIHEKEGKKAFRLYQNGKKELTLTEDEIQNFLLSKAAMFSFLYVFVKAVGLSFSDIRKIFIAGALGSGINPENAVKIGMLPDIPRERFIPLGNSALGGAEMALLDRRLLPEIDEVASKITYREMNEDAELMNVLQGAMFIPHTNPALLKG